jgi:hypothetical protein
MMIKKYVISNGFPVLFSTEFTHAHVADKIGTVESAGFFLIIYNKKKQPINIICMGESTSLHINSRPQIDAKIIRDFLIGNMQNKVTQNSST